MTESGWRRHFFYTRQCVRTTWKLRLALLILVVVLGASTKGFWARQIGLSLVCARELAPSDAILVENFDPEYVIFERAAALEKAGLAPRAFVPVPVSRDPGVPNLVSRGVAEVMARQARLGAWEMIPIREVEPISLNAAFEVRDHLARRQVSSLIVVTPGLRSRRSVLVYGAVLGGNGTQVRCDPVFGSTSAEHWAQTWHGIQGVSEEFLKLQYYRFYVLPLVHLK